MALRITGPDQGVSTTEGLPVTRSWTITCWFHLDTIRATTQPILSMESAAEYAGLWVVYDAGFWRLAYVWSGDDSPRTSGGAVDADTWYRVALVINGTNATLYQGTAEEPLTVYTNTAEFELPTGAMTLYLGSSAALGSDGWPDGRIAAVKMWDEALSIPSEVDFELRCYLPIRTDNIDRWYPLVDSDDLMDYSGHGYALTGSGMSTGGGPPIQWHSVPADPVIPWDSGTPLWAAVYTVDDGNLWSIGLVSDLTLPLADQFGYKTFLTQPDLTQTYWDPDILDFNNLPGPVYVDRFDDLLVEDALADIWAALDDTQIQRLRARQRLLLGPSLWWRYDYQGTNIGGISGYPIYTGEPTIS